MAKWGQRLRKQVSSTEVLIWHLLYDRYIFQPYFHRCVTCEPCNSRFYLLPMPHFPRILLLRKKKKKEEKWKRKRFWPGFLRMLPSASVSDAFSTALSTQNPQINARFFHLHICYCHCCCATSLGSNVVHFSFRFVLQFFFAPFLWLLLLFNFQLLVLYDFIYLQLKYLCDALHLRIVQMYIRCINAFCFYTINSSFSCFWPMLLLLLLLFPMALRKSSKRDSCMFLWSNLIRFYIDISQEIHRFTGAFCTLYIVHIFTSSHSCQGSVWEFFFNKIVYILCSSFGLLWRKKERRRQWINNISKIHFTHKVEWHTHTHTEWLREWQFSRNKV